MSEVKPDGTFEKLPGGVTNVWFQGKQWHVPLFDPAKDFTAAENYLRSKRRDPLAAIKGQLEGQPENVVREILDRVYRDLKKGDEERQIPRHEVADWLDTMDGLYWSLWTAMKREYTDLTLDTVKEMFNKVALAEGLKLRDEALTHG